MRDGSMCRLRKKRQDRGKGHRLRTEVEAEIQEEKQEEAQEQAQVQPETAAQAVRHLCPAVANYNGNSLPSCSCLFCINDFVVECNDGGCSVQCSVVGQCIALHTREPKLAKG